MVGTLLTTIFWDHDFSDSIDGTTTNPLPQCMIIQTTKIDDDKELEYTIQIVPNESQICVGGITVTVDENSGTTNDNNVKGVVMGFSTKNDDDDNNSRRSSLQLLDGMGFGRTIDTTTSSYPLSYFTNQTIPVTSTNVVRIQNDDDGTYYKKVMYVGLISTGGMQYPELNNNNPGTDLHNLVTYINTVTQPPFFNDILKVNRYDFQLNTIDLEIGLQVQGTSGRFGSISALEVVGLDTTGPGELIIAGSTNGQNNADLGISGIRQETDWDFDGYLSFRDAITGDLVHSIRIDSQPGQNDFVKDTCVHGSSLYVVGKTEGHMETVNDLTNDRTPPHDGGAFVIQLNWETRKFEYKLTIPSMGKGRKCLATADGVYVGFYVDGNVNSSAGRNNAVISQDVVITKLSHDLSTNGNAALWSQWLDTTQDVENDIRQDYLVGMELMPDGSGNVAVLLNSMNSKQGLNDIYIIELDKQSGSNSLPSRGGYQPPVVNLTEQQQQQQQVPPTSQSPPQSQPSSNMTNGSEQEKKITIWVAVAIPVFLLLSVISYHVASNVRPAAATANGGSGGNNDVAADELPSWPEQDLVVNGEDCVYV